MSREEMMIVMEEMLFEEEEDEEDLAGPVVEEVLHKVIKKPSRGEAVKSAAVPIEKLYSE